jgi:hypothetical protein
MCVSCYAADNGDDIVSAETRWSICSVMVSVATIILCFKVSVLHVQRPHDLHLSCIPKGGKGH